ncbi:uncharacterized protein [Onthophagus taurus]|uniref:uncharacterized protein n=1 Tax=Onthophagus taurus TaxID=166361 RepID=UPI000C20C41C|nr:uncharacterized protein LOC111418698 [Onthophagus taurus]
MDIMDQFRNETELIGFKNNQPVTRKRNLGLGVEGKSVVLTGNNKVIILQNNKSVRIPMRLCTMVPENVRKAVLEQLPNIKDKKHVEAKPYRNGDNENNQKSGTSHELVAVKTEPEEVELIKRKMDVNEVKPNRIRAKKKIVRRSNQQKTLQNIVKLLKRNQKGKLKRNLTKRSISCQTEAFTNDISCQTDELIGNEILSLFENIDKDSILGSPSDFMTIDYPSPGNYFVNNQNNQLQSDYGNHLDVRKVRFYENLKNCDCPDAAGHIPLHIAVLHNNKAEVHNQCLLLKARKFSVDVPNNQGNTPLHLAVLNESDIEIIKVLLANGADPLMKDGNGNTSLHNAIHSNEDEQILQILLNHLKKTEENVDVFNYEGFTPLMLCVIEDKHKMAMNCIAAGANPNTKDQKSGRTSLFHAVENNNLQMVKLFMRTGANTKIKNFFGTSTHEATFELESINPEIKTLIIGKEINGNRTRIAIAKKKKKVQQTKSIELPTFKNKLKTVRILKIIEKDIRK